MWDVKCTFSPICCSDILSCFTLTMWDVKSDANKIENALGYKFYLNYVGCKGIRLPF